MFSRCRQRTPNRSALRRICAGFTLSEIVVALAILGTMASGVYIGFNSINAYAVSTRLYSEANTAAQNQIDMILSKEPFDVSSAYISGTFNPCLKKVPAELLTTAELDLVATTTCSDGSGPVAFPTSAPTSTPAASAYYPAYYPYYRTGVGQPLQKQAFIYHDPLTGQDIVKGTLTTTVTDTGMTMAAFANSSPGATPTPLNTRKANVSVQYSFRSKDPSPSATPNYTVGLNTLRAADR